MNLVVLELTKEGLKKQFGKNSKRKLKKTNEIGCKKVEGGP